MPYIGNTIRAADDYRLIDDISSSFNGSTTSFALQVAGSSPVPFPKSPQQVLISVNGVIQEPDPTGASGFNLVGTNIVFSSAPTNGHAFFGIIYATADYLNAGGNFPSGSLGAPSFTFIGDENTGLYRKSGGSVGFVSDATEIANFDSNGITISSGNLILGDSSGASDDRIKLGASGDLEVYHNGSNSYIDDSGTGSLIVRSNQFLVRNIANDHQIIGATAGGSVDLYHNNSKKLETTSGGVSITGAITATGTASTGQLTTKGSQEPQIIIQDSDSGNTGNAAETGISFRDGGGTQQGIMGFSNSGDQDFYFDTASTSGEMNFRVGGSTTQFKVDNSGIGITGSITVSGTVDGVDVAALSSSVSAKLSNVVDDTTPQLGGNLDCNNKVVTLNDSTGSDNNRFKIGNGGDFQIYHDGSHSRLDDLGTGSLLLQTNGSNIQLNKGTSENMLIANIDGSVELYHDNSKKFETTSTGAAVTGSVFKINHSGSVNLVVGSTNAGGAYLVLDGDSDGNASGGDYTYFEHSTAGDLNIVQNNPNSNGKIDFFTGGAGRVSMQSDKFRPSNNNAMSLGTSGLRWSDLYLANDIYLNDGGLIRFGDSGSDLLMQHSSGHNFIEGGSGFSGNLYLRAKLNENGIILASDGAVELYNDNVKRFSTNSTGAQVYGNNGTIFTASCATNSTASVVFSNTEANTSGDMQLQIKTAANQGSDPYIKFDAGGNDMVVGTLYAGGANNKLVLGHGLSPSGGVIGLHIDGNGQITPDSNNARDLGNSSLRFRNIYTNDLNLSNEGSSNDVDGTWGNYTIQEGAEDLFLINRRNGKKFKFNLMEVA